MEGFREADNEEGGELAEGICGGRVEEDAEVHQRKWISGTRHPEIKEEDYTRTYKRRTCCCTDHGCVERVNKKE